MRKTNQISRKDLEPYIEAMRQAQTPQDLEQAFQTIFQLEIAGRIGPNSKTMVERVRLERGREMCASHPQGRFVPVLGDRRRLSVCGETYRVARGGNSAGMRYSWTNAQTWATDVMVRYGLSYKAAHQIWESWRHWPHRALRVVELAAEGKIHDPRLNVLVKHERHGNSGSPIRYSHAENMRSGVPERASRACPCGSTLFDWGGGITSGVFYFVNWHCITCPDVFTEYMTPADFSALRTPARMAA